MKQLPLLTALILLSLCSRAQDYFPLPRGIHSIFLQSNNQFKEIWIDSAAALGPDSIYYLAQTAGEGYVTAFCAHERKGRLIGTAIIKRGVHRYEFLTAAGDTFILNLNQVTGTDAPFSPNDSTVKIIPNGIQWMTVGTIQDSVMEFLITGLAAYNTPVIWLSKKHGILKTPDLNDGQMLRKNKTLSSAVLHTQRGALTELPFRSSTYEMHAPGDTLVVHEFYIDQIAGTYSETYTYRYFLETQPLGADWYTFRYLETVYIHSGIIQEPGTWSSSSIEKTDTQYIPDLAIREGEPFIGSTATEYFGYNKQGSLITRTRYNQLSTKSTSSCFEAIPGSLPDQWMAYPYGGDGYFEVYDHFGISSGKRLLYLSHDSLLYGYFPYFTQFSGIAPKEEIVSTIFPNPAQSAVNILSNETITRISIQALSGSILLNQNQESLSSFIQVDIQSLPAGIYLLQLETLTGKATHKLIKH